MTTTEVILPLHQEVSQRSRMEAQKETYKPLGQMRNTTWAERKILQINPKTEPYVKW
jgi:hypothetical protein